MCTLFLSFRGADPNDVDNKGTTPLMIAAKLGRDEVIDELMSLVIDDSDDIKAPEVDDDDQSDDALEKPAAIKSVNVNAKHRKTTKAPIHYAAKNGHEVRHRFIMSIFNIE